MILPGKETEIYLVRHGESVRNLASDTMTADPTLHYQLIRAGGEDWELTDKGKGQAENLGSFLRGSNRAHFACGYTSPLVRAVGTALGLGLECEWIRDERLRERRWGDFTDPRLAAISVDEYLVLIRESIGLDWRSSGVGAESIRDRYEPVRSFIAEVLARHGGERIIISTHGAALRAFQMVLEGIPPERYGELPNHRTPNCGVLVYSIADLNLANFTWNAQVSVLQGACVADSATGNM